MVELWTRRTELLRPVRLDEAATDTDEKMEACLVPIDALDEMIIATEAHTVVGLSIKGRLACEIERETRFRPPWSPLDDPKNTEGMVGASLYAATADAVRLAMAHSEAARADADLLALEAEVVEARKWMDSHPKVPDDSPVYEAKHSLLREIETKIAEAPAAGLVGAAVKLRRVLDPFIGIEICPSDKHILAIRTALETVERLAKGNALCDPVVALVAEWKKCWAECSPYQDAPVGTPESEKEEALIVERGGIESRLLAATPTTTEGVALLWQFLEVFARDYASDDFPRCLRTLREALGRLGVRCLDGVQDDVKFTHEVWGGGAP